MAPVPLLRFDVRLSDTPRRGNHCSPLPPGVGRSSEFFPPPSIPKASGRTRALTNGSSVAPKLERLLASKKLLEAAPWSRQPLSISTLQPQNAAHGQRSLNDRRNRANYFWKIGTDYLFKDSPAAKTAGAIRGRLSLWVL